MEDLDPAQVYRDRLKTIRPILVDDIMTTQVVIAEIMIKKSIKRFPVVEDQTVVGTVYVSDVFYHLMTLSSRRSDRDGAARKNAFYTEQIFKRS